MHPWRNGKFLVKLYQETWPPLLHRPVWYERTATIPLSLWLYRQGKQVAVDLVLAYHRHQKSLSLLAEEGHGNPKSPIKQLMTLNSLILLRVVLVSSISRVNCGAILCKRHCYVVKCRQLGCLRKAPSPHSSKDVISIINILVLRRRG